MHSGLSHQAERLKCAFILIGALYNGREMKSRHTVRPRHLMTVDDLAQYLKVSRRTIYKLLRSGQFPLSLKRVDGFYWDRYEVDRWIAQHQAKNWTKRNRTKAESTSSSTGERRN